MTEADRAADLISDFRWARWILLVLGLLCMVAGVIVLAEPKDSLATMAVIIGIFLVVDGIFDIVLSLLAGTDRRALTVLIGIAGIVVGVILIRHPFHSVVALALFVGLWLIVAGAIRLTWAFDEREDRGWRLLVAVVEIIAGIVIVAIPGIGLTALAVIIGISLILRGIGIATVGWLAHEVVKDSHLTPRGPATAT